VWGVWGEIISSQFLLFPLFPLFPIPVSTDNLLNLTVLTTGLPLLVLAFNDISLFGFLTPEARRKCGDQDEG
jgi:hypothetical protein